MEACHAGTHKNTCCVKLLLLQEGAQPKYEQKKFWQLVKSQKVLVWGWALDVPLHPPRPCLSHVLGPHLNHLFHGTCATWHMTSLSIIRSVVP